jgi:hypothetical protein
VGVDGGVVDDHCRHSDVGGRASRPRHCD